jgi:hypothetical protein
VFVPTSHLPGASTSPPPFRNEVLHSVQRRDMTQTECESFRDCDTTWGAQACNANPESGTFQMHPDNGKE